MSLLLLLLKSHYERSGPINKFVQEKVQIFRKKYRPSKATDSSDANERGYYQQHCEDPNNKTVYQQSFPFPVGIRGYRGTVCHNVTVVTVTSNHVKHENMKTLKSKYQSFYFAAGV